MMMQQETRSRRRAPMTWRRMTRTDLPAVSAIAAEVHPDYPEDDAILAERLALYPLGCLMLSIDGEPLGYVISHPWAGALPPSLNSLLGRLPARPESYYLHDIALLARARGSGASALAMQELTAQARAERLGEMALVAVGGTSGFWQRHGFEIVSDAALPEKLASYGEQARFMRRIL